jgi:hypothetical protein
VVGDEAVDAVVDLLDLRVVDPGCRARDNRDAERERLLDRDRVRLADLRRRHEDVARPVEREQPLLVARRREEPDVVEHSQPVEPPQLRGRRADEDDLRVRHLLEQAGHHVHEDVAPLAVVAPPQPADDGTRRVEPERLLRRHRLGRERTHPVEREGPVRDAMPRMELVAEAAPPPVAERAHLRHEEVGGEPVPVGRVDLAEDVRLDEHGHPGAADRLRDERLAAAPAVAVHDVGAGDQLGEPPGAAVPDLHRQPRGAEVRLARPALARADDPHADA